MKPYIISHMMMSVDGRIDCPMVAQISGEEYYAALDSFGTSSKLSGRVTAALECSAVAEETSVNAGTGIGTRLLKATSTPLSLTLTDACRWLAIQPMGIRCLLS